MKTNIDFWSYLAQFLLEWEMFREQFIEKPKTHILYSITFFFTENRAVCVIMWKNIAQPGQATDGNMAYAHCILDT